MPDPGSHKYDVQRTRLRAEYDDHGVPDQHADAAANAELQREHPPVRVGDPDRAAGPKGERPPAGPPSGREPAHLELRSPAFADHTLMPNRFSYDRDNASPPLEWRGVPEGTTELALLCEDPDAPNGTFVHWMVTQISPTASGVRENTQPSGTPARNGFGERGWSGPQPPVGDDPHRYFFRLYAFDHHPSVGPNVPPQDLHTRLSSEATATGTLVGLFAR
jgi:Raf kinase inhibitor-like YbhB/YbcL family protein